MSSTQTRRGKLLMRCRNMRAAFVIVLVCAVAFVTCEAPAGLLRFDSGFKCQVCHKFCIEYEKKIKEKKGDAPFDIAVQQARGNTSNYRWDAKHTMLRPPGQRIGEPVIDEIYVTLDSELLSVYNVQVILHALHAAAHLQRPPQMSFAFCQRVLCTEHLQHCPVDGDKRPFGEMSKAYLHFVEEFDRQHHNPRMDKHRRQAHVRRDIYASEIRQQFAEGGRFDPASHNEETQLRMMHELQEAERKANYYRMQGEDL